MFRLARYLVFAIFLPQLTFAAVDPVFQKLLALSQGESPEVRSADARLRQAQDLRFGSWTTWAPRLDLRFSKTVSKDDSFLYNGMFGSLASSLTVSESNVHAWRLDMSWPLYSRSVHAVVGQRANEYEVSKIEARLARGQLQWELRQQYGQTLLHLYRRATLRRLIQIGKDTLRETEIRFSSGSRTRVDVLKAQAQVAQYESQFESAGADLIQARLKLISVAGVTEATWSQWELELGQTEDQIQTRLQDFSEISKDERAWVAELARPERLEQRIASGPSHQRIKSQKAVEEWQSESAWAAEWPSLKAVASWSRQRGDWNETLKPNDPSYSYGISLDIPLFSFGGGVMQYRAAREMRVLAEVKERRSLQDLDATVKSLLQRARAVDRLIGSLQISSSQSAEVEKLTKQSYQLGRSTLLEYQIAQSDVLASRLQLAQSIVDYAVVVWQIKWHLNGGA